VDDFNLLLRKEERFVIPENEGLNTELRIFALVWLGINSSSKIANLLHLSPQTVYNARMKIKNKAIADNEKFAEIVRALGREKIGV
jgi:DNA-binding CsgD family transcriptional regulator